MKPMTRGALPPPIYNRYAVIGTSATELWSHWWWIEDYELFVDSAVLLRSAVEEQRFPRNSNGVETGKSQFRNRECSYLWSVGAVVLCLNPKKEGCITIFEHMHELTGCVYSWLIFEKRVLRSEVASSSDPLRLEFFKQLMEFVLVNLPGVNNSRYRWLNLRLLTWLADLTLRCQQFIVVFLFLLFFLFCTFASFSSYFLSSSRPNIQCGLFSPFEYIVLIIGTMFREEIGMINRFWYFRVE